MTLAETHALRGYDAVQLAAALEVNMLCVGSDLSTKREKKCLSSL